MKAWRAVHARIRSQSDRFHQSRVEAATGTVQGRGVARRAEHDWRSDRAALSSALKRVWPAATNRAAFRLRPDAKLFGVCLRILKSEMEAEDLLQDVYVTVWRKAGEFDGNRPIHLAGRPGRATGPSTGAGDRRAAPATMASPRASTPKTLPFDPSRAGGAESTPEECHRSLRSSTPMRCVGLLRRPHSLSKPWRAGWRRPLGAIKAQIRPLR